MIDYVLDCAFLLVVVFTTLFVAARLVVESAIIFLAVVIASLLSITLFEPIAGWCSLNLFSQSDVLITRFLWFFFAVLIFVAALGSLLHLFFQVVGDVPQLGKLTESIGSWVFGGVTGYFLASFLLTLLHTLPGPRDFWGSFEPEVQRRTGLITRLAPDYQFLTIVDYVCVPRSPLTGSPWKPSGPLVSTEFKKGRWASFPVRYAIWREGLELLFSEPEPASTNYDEADYSDADFEDVEAVDTNSTTSNSDHSTTDSDHDLRPDNDADDNFSWDDE